MNDQEREMWVMNHEGLYSTWKRSRLSKRNFIRENRDIIDGFINNVLNKKPRDFEILTVAELIVTAGRLKWCRDSLEEIAEGIKTGTFDIDCVSVIIDNTLDWLAKD